MGIRHQLGEPVVVVAGVEKSFGAFSVLKDVSLTVRRGETVCIIGPSGSGKSTLLRCINALVPISQGSITVAGREVHDPKLNKLELRRDQAGATSGCRHRLPAIQPVSASKRAAERD